MHSNGVSAAPLRPGSTHNFFFSFDRALDPERGPVSGQPDKRMEWDPSLVAVPGSLDLDLALTEIRFRGH